MNALAEARMLRRPFRFRLGRLQVLSVLFLVELAVFGALRPAYLSMPGLLDASRSFVEAGLLALGMTLVIITGGIDLSVASLLALVSVTLGFSSAAGLPLPLAMAFFRGLAYAVTNANAVSTFPDWFADFGQSYLWDLVPFQVIVWLAAVFAIWVLLNRTSFGRYVYGLGINERVTVFSGINTLKVKVAVYTLSGFFAAIAAMIQTSRVFTARANAASGLELTVIAMVALGGTRITGGSGSILGTTLGVLILGYLQDGLGFVGVRNDWALVVTGIVLVLAVFANEFFRKESR